tara:strand:- start:1227 stop:1982 length:756 start_codon:yes stop_codon:yes gene_type:complete
LSLLTQSKRPDLINTVEVNDETELGLVPAWSHSALKVFETCAYKTYISKVKRVQEDYGPAAARGTDIHQQAEDYVKGTLAEMPDTLKKFQNQFKFLREEFINAAVELEGDWGFTRQWEVCGWMDPTVWARVKLDALVHESETSARVIDYKTGRQFGNEIAHSQQALTYAIGSFFRYPKLEIVKTELWYLDHGTTMEQVYTRDEAMVFMPKLHERATEMTTATKFPPNPSSVNCRWCSFGKGESPYCEWSAN